MTTILPFPYAASKPGGLGRSAASSGPALPSRLSVCGPQRLLPVTVPAPGAVSPCGGTPTSVPPAPHAGLPPAPPGADRALPIAGVGFPDLRPRARGALRAHLRPPAAGRHPQRGRLPRLRSAPGGFARIRCAGCGAEHLLAFSCRTRNLCPSCQSKRSAVGAAWLEASVFLDVAHRHVVLTIPKKLRGLIERDRALHGLMARVGYAVLRRALAEAACEPEGVPGR